MPIHVDFNALPTAYVSGEVPSVCIAYTAVTYHLSPRILLAVLKAENGRSGVESPNANKSTDIGPMQVNSRWLPLLATYGITREQLRDDGCVSVWVGGWILRMDIDSMTGFWRGVGAYNSRTSTPGHDINAGYAVRVSRNLDKLSWVEAALFGLSW